MIQVHYAYSSELSVNMHVLTTQKSIFVHSEGSVVFTDGKRVESIGKNRKIEIVFVPGSDKLLLFRDDKLYLSGSDFILKSTDEFTINNSKKRLFSKKGLFFHIDDDRVEVILKIGISAYLMGVVNSEMGDRFPIEALKAQAVAARTYVMYMIAKKGIAYKNHVPSSNYGQVYSYDGNYSDKIKQAVKDTKGEVLVYKGKPILAMYSSCCGGVREDISERFGGKSLEYLRVKRDHFYLTKIEKDTKKALELYSQSNCQSCPNYRWTREYSPEKITELLGIEGKIDDIEVSKIDDSGRVKKVIVTAGTIIRSYSGAKIRKKLKLPSTFFYITKDSDSFLYTIKGGGMGHGIGMCQWGAIGLAREHLSYKKILDFYYPGSELIKFY
jgi:stage II sporulation protein D